MGSSTRTWYWKDWDCPPASPATGQLSVAPAADPSSPLVNGGIRSYTVMGPDVSPPTLVTSTL